MEHGKRNDRCVRKFIVKMSTSGYNKAVREEMALGRKYKNMEATIWFNPKR